jgi:hypothetical protein
MKNRFRLSCSLFVFLFLAASHCLSCPNLFARPTYESKSFADIHSAVSSLGRTNAILVLSGRQKLSRDLVVPANITLRFQDDASLLVEESKSVKIEAPIQASLIRIFEGDGKVILKHSEIYPQWWGARGDGLHDDGYAIQSAIDSAYYGGGGLVRLLGGTYLLNHITGPYYALKSRNRVSFSGEGYQSVLRVGGNLRQATRGVAVLYNHEEVVSNCRYSNFLVDYNGLLNLRLASWGSTAYVSNVSRMGADFAANILIEEVLFKNVSGAHCIWFGNHPTNHGNIVRNCHVSNVGQSIIGNELTDHSSIYMGGKNGLITGNTFHNQTPCNISTAIEVHSSGTIISNNSVVNYSTAVNIAGEANDCSNVFLSNNIFRNNRNGIVIWHYSPHVMKDITVSENLISVRETDSTPYPPSMGIIYGGGYVTSNNNLQTLTISGNIFFQETITLPNRKPNTAIHIESVDDLSIKGNTIYNFNGEGIYVQSRSRDQGIRNIFISDNKIRNVGLTSYNDRKRAVVLNAYPTASGQITNVLIQNNELIGGGTTPMENGIAFNAGSFRQVEISGNHISGVTNMEIFNLSPDCKGIFRIEHRGRGKPPNNLCAGEGSRWVDLTTDRKYQFQGTFPNRSSTAGWVPME